jgi:heterodisulfide reductase subunit C
MACGASMIWDCVTCYQCQEHCPQLVEVTDILYQLKNMAIKGPRRGRPHKTKRMHIFGKRDRN